MNGRRNLFNFLVIAGIVVAVMQIAVVLISNKINLGFAILVAIAAITIPWYLLARIANHFESR